MATRFITLALAAVAFASPAAQTQKRAAASVIATCTKPGVIALTFDDGPYDYTGRVLDLLGEAGMKATFFVNGQNWGNIYSYEDTVQRAVAEGHQIGSHTWSHPDITTLSAEELTSQMTGLEDALVDIVGKYPVYMRPPFFSWGAESLETLGDLGYKVIHADVDTLDWEGDMGASIENFNHGIDAGGSIVLAHEVHEATVEVLVPAMISAVQASGLRAVTVGECLGDPARNWYSTRDDVPDPPTDPEPTDPVPSDPVPRDPVPTASVKPSDPVPSDPVPTDSVKPTDPLPSDPLPTDPLPTDPLPTDPLPTDPVPSNPKPTDPVPTDPTYPEEPTPTDPQTAPTKGPGSCRAKKHRRKAKRVRSTRPGSEVRALMLASAVEWI